MKRMNAFDFAAKEGAIIPIQIREDLTVRIGRIPHDLTVAEAEKIGRVVLALAAPAALTKAEVE